MIPDLLALVGGLALLMAAATALVRGAASLALRLGLSPLVVGLTVVAFGTSAPELVVSVQAALAGAGGIAVGNVVGSNIANVGLILALAVLVRPIATDPTVLRRDLPVLLATTVAVSVLLLDGQLGALEGAGLIAALLAYLAWSVRQARRDSAEATLPVAEPGPVWRDAALVAGGLGGLVLGADLFVGGAVALAEGAGVSNAVIGLTVVAVGTSLPELATSVVAAARGEGELAVGNVVGSNVFNLLGILGIGAIVRPLVAPGLQVVDLAVMAAFAAVLVPMMVSGRRLVRPEAMVLLAAYVGYIGYLAVLHG
ncbi:calcium/sodium antiporter [Rubrivirga sp. IMCC43871]|uniref:calcium/sodium antiporter n=1 Tax=Rubrivirga sp. IMCC43871 TaxID=3391575 RepID=UPI00398FEB29